MVMTVDITIMIEMVGHVDIDGNYDNRLEIVDDVSDD